MKLKDKKPILIIGALIGFLSYLYSIKEDYIINPSQSLPRGIYKLYPPTDIKKGDIVVFEISEDLQNYMKQRGYILSNVTTLMKKVAAFSDDTIEIKNQEIFINNISWGKIYEFDSKYRPLRKLESENLIVKKDEFFALSAVNKSFDSRYFGAIKVSKIVAKSKIFLKFWLTFYMKTSIINISNKIN